MIKSYIIRRLAKENFESEVVPLRNAKSTLILFGDLKGSQAAEAILIEQELLKVVPNLTIDICGVVKANKKEEFAKKSLDIWNF